MARIAFLSQDSMDGYVCDDDAAVPALAARGIKVETVSWRAAADWAGYDAVIVRSTWDYQRHAADFLATLAGIESATRLANPLTLMRWNLDKRYLGELAQSGVAIVPTVFGESLSHERFDALLDAANGESVIKPVVSAGAERTYRVPRTLSDQQRDAIVAAHAAGAWMWQPFLPQIVSEGEFSLFFFSGRLSHTILKTPKAGDFRVQEEFGGHIRAVPGEPTLVAAAERVIAALDDAPLYARVDLVRAGDDSPDAFWLIELELIEPSLYLRTEPGAPARFADAVAAWLG